jgi:hypothetical protein
LYSRELSHFSTAAAKKNDTDRLAIPKLAETLRIGFCQTF